MAIRDQVIDLNMLPTLIVKAPQLYQELSEGIHTNLNLQQVIQLAYLAQQIDRKSIKRGVITPDMVNFGKSPDGLDIMKPIPDKIRILRDEIFTSGGPLSPAAVATDPAELARNEQARIQILNGSSTAGLAQRTAEYFRSLGWNVISEANADRVYAQSQLVDYSGKPYTMKSIAELMKVPTGNVFSSYDPNAQVDVVVVVGEDWAANNTLP